MVPRYSGGLNSTNSPNSPSPNPLNTDARPFHTSLHHRLCHPRSTGRLIRRPRHLLQSRELHLLHRVPAHRTAQSRRHRPSRRSSDRPSRIPPSCSCQRNHLRPGVHYAPQTKPPLPPSTPTTSSPHSPPASSDTPSLKKPKAVSRNTASPQPSALELQIDRALLLPSCHFMNQAALLRESLTKHTEEFRSRGEAASCLKGGSTYCHRELGIFHS